MRIAIAQDGINVSGHFGHCEGFQVYQLEAGKIMTKRFLENPGHKPGFLPKYLSENKINVIIAGGMGGSAQTLFLNNNIEVVVGAQGHVENVIDKYISGDLISSKSVCNEHEHKGNCG